MGTHSSILAWEIPWRSLVGYIPGGLKKRVGHNLATKTKEYYTVHFKMVTVVNFVFCVFHHNQKLKQEINLCGSLMGRI